MSESSGTPRDDDRSPDFFDQLIETNPRDTSSASTSAFTIGFRGYDKGEVDAALASMRTQLQQAADEVAEAKAREA
ncbi:DivIVA domain-containing protein, partial [Mycobacterium tuberculosis]|uniref:DivIVA domain-containing protein n=1 Tax=Mycobacterium tuberculosis TaxID=1773 RepID=UPI000B322160